MIRLLIAFLFLITLFSCNTYDDNIVEPEISWEWNLSKTVGGFDASTIEFDKGIILWNINTTLLMITIENNSSIGTGHAGLDSGAYNYIIEHREDGDHIIIENQELGLLNTQNTILEIAPSEYSDPSTQFEGFTFTFQKWNPLIILLKY